jgi:hypothetical protein
LVEHPDFEVGEVVGFEKSNVFEIINATLAQLVEQLICNQQVVGSSPTSGSEEIPKKQIQKSKDQWRLVFGFNNIGILLMGK